MIAMSDAHALLAAVILAGLILWAFLRTVARWNTTPRQHHIDSRQDHTITYPQLRDELGTRKTRAQIDALNAQAERDLAIAAVNQLIVEKQLGETRPMALEHVRRQLGKGER